MDGDGQAPAGGAPKPGEEGWVDREAQERGLRELAAVRAQDEELQRARLAAKAPTNFYEPDISRTTFATLSVLGLGIPFAVAFFGYLGGDPLGPIALAEFAAFIIFVISVMLLEAGRKGVSAYLLILTAPTGMQFVVAFLFATVLSSASVVLGLYVIFIGTLIAYFVLQGKKML